MGNISPSQLLASSTPVEFKPDQRASVNVAIVFYEDVAGTTPIDASAGGTADLTITRDAPAEEGSRPAVTRVGLPVLDFDGGTKVAATAGVLYLFALGSGANDLIITATNITGPGAPTALSYRLFVDTSTRG